MRWTIRVLASSAVIVCIAVLVANAQTPQPSSSQQLSEVQLQQRVAALEKEVQSLKSELAALRTEIAEMKMRIDALNARFAGMGTTPAGLGALPSYAAIQACVKAAQGLPNDYKDLGVQSGTPFTSQGGIIELGMGAPKGTTIFPIKVQMSRSVDYWVFTDSFGKVHCEEK